ncbi:MAG TPA: NUDIX domain-containing protein [Ensifer sp.]|nr:NUDIX domain-containing protein [Ensifer sp.]
MKQPRDPGAIGPIRKPLLYLVHLWFRMKRGLTLGVRAAAFDDKGRVFLIRHTYMPGWQFPGGGVEVDETALEAMERELFEEGNVTLGAAPQLFSVYLNTRVTNRDHVLLYVCRDVRCQVPKVPDKEIAESGFFGLDALPEGTTQATRQRLMEIAGEDEVQPIW